jgi:sugar O-acyltransferase (sialic acid O-acetyltransferase NeuD family)
MKNIVIIGAGGHGREIVQLIKDVNKIENKWNIMGYVDDNPKIIGDVLNGYPVLGPLELLGEEKYRDVYVVCAIGSSNIREIVLKKIKDTSLSLLFATLIHPTAVIGDETKIGEGVTISANSVITNNIIIGNHAIINYGTTIGHDSLIEEYATILPGSNISGNVTIGKGVDIGSGTTIIPGVKIGRNTIVGAGAVVTKSLPANCTAVGVPAKPIKYHNNN